MDFIRFRESAHYSLPLSCLVVRPLLLPPASENRARMNDQERYEDAARRLAVYRYDVYSESPGYIVRHRADNNDISRMRDLDDLIEFAHLIEWREQRQTLTERKEPPPVGGGS
jgi:hypothetical protein